MPPQPYDSPAAAGKFILGLFLFFGLFSFSRYGASQLYSIYKGDGTVTITGYVGEAYSKEYGPINEQDLHSYKTYYYLLFDHPRQGGEPKVIVQHHESQIGWLGVYPTSPAPQALPKVGSKVTVSGIFDREEKTSPRILIEGATPPRLLNTLLWFIPTIIGWLAGVWLIIRWVFLVRAFYKKPTKI